MGRNGHLEHPRTPAGAWLPPAVRIGLRIWAVTLRAARDMAAPLFDLIVRLTLAQGLLASALVKLADWNVALSLAANEYPVRFMAPENAAVLGVAIELCGGIALLLGLFTRPAALAVAALLAVSQIAYVPTDANLFAIAILLLYLIRGPGLLALDRLFRPGLRLLPLPLVPAVIALADRLPRLTPLALTGLRLWLALTLIVAAGSATAMAGSPWLPIASFGWAPPLLLLGAATLLLVGLATPLISLLLALSLGGAQMMAMAPGLTSLSSLFVLMFLFAGAGRPSVDEAVAAWLHRHVLFDRRIDRAPADWPHIVVIGGGFGGLACVAALKRLPVRITLIDRNNYHLFQPLLYQVATAALSPADVATPIRSLYREDGNVRVLLGDVHAVDRSARQVHFGDECVNFDMLVVATGASHSYFGKDQWGPFAPGLKRIEDAVAVRADVLRAFERAEAASDPVRIARLMTFVIVGAGPTGVELAGAIAELARFGLRHEYRAIDPAAARIILVQSGPRVLPAFDDRMSAHAMASLRALGVDVRLDARVTDIQPDHVMVGGERIDTETVLWAAGVVASPAARWLGAASDPAGRVIVGDDLSIADDPDIFVIGDTASSMAWEGRPVPGLAPAAKQAGVHVARVIRARLAGRGPIAPFAYRHQGSLATIGRKAAVADFGRVQLHGALAWWLWGLVHVGFLVGVRNRASVLVNWIWNYFTQQLGIRLITAQRAGMPASDERSA